MISLPRREHLIKTSAEDPLDFYYYPAIRYVYLKRFEMAISLMSRRCARLLDIGVGSGIFLKELSMHADFVHGIDVHEKIEQVSEMITREGIAGEVKTGTVYQIPFAEGFFDCVVSMSVFEHLTDLNTAMTEVRRVLKPSGDFILGFPVRNVVTDTFFRVAGYNPRQIHPSSHTDILAHLRDKFVIKKTLSFPAWLQHDLGLYVCCLAR